jgi:hypothetical protein
MAHETCSGQARIFISVATFRQWKSAFATLAFQMLQRVGTTIPASSGFFAMGGALFLYRINCDLVYLVLPCYPRCLRLAFASPMIWKWN